MSDQFVTVRIRTSRLRMLLVVLTTTALVAPTAVWAADRFDDVPASDVFHDDIAWMADNGVTVGCNPPGNDEFCPNDVVTRAQMAAFIRRLDSRDVFATFDEMDGLLPIATVTVDGIGGMLVESHRDPVTEITSRQRDVGWYALDVEGLGTTDQTRIVCSASNTTTDRAVSTIPQLDSSYDIRTWNITTGEPANSPFTCAIYG